MVDIRKKRKFPPKGPGQPMQDAEIIDVVKADEKWSTYELDDGTQIKARPALIEICRVIGEYDREGNPVYVIKAQQIVNAVVPDNLKKGGQK